MRILAIIPCYNHGKYIEYVVDGVKKYVKDIIIIDDGSTDDTPKILRRVKKVKKVRHRKNFGKGAALKTGFQYAVENKYDAVITIDADSQHKYYDIPIFLKNYSKGDIIIGTRMHNVKNMPLRRKLANRISSKIVSSVCKQKITDSQSGFRLIKTKVIKNIKLENKGYQQETEILLKAAKKGYRIHEVPVDTIYGEEVSHINPFTITFRFIRVVLLRK